MIKDSLVLCATSHHLLAGYWLASKLQGCQSFNNDAEGHIEFTQFLQQHAMMPVYLIVDAVEENYRLETVPHTTGVVNRELITRKLNQFYRGLEFRTAHFVNRAQDNRRDDKYLFVALNNADFLQEWIKVLKSVEAQLVGVYLLPMLSQVIVKQLKLMAPDILLCEKLSSGLRQTYLHNGRLRMSRLAPSLPTEKAKLTHFYLAEVEKTRLYLVSQRFITHETPLNLVLTSIEGNTQPISQHISGEQPNIECTDLNVNQFINNLNLPVNLVEKMPELVHMQLLASGHIVDNLAPEALTQVYDFGKLKRVIKNSTWALGTLGLMAAAGIFYQGYDYQSNFHAAIQDTVIQQHRYDEAAKNFPVTTLSAENLKAAVELDQSIAAYPKSPRRIMQVVSAALAQVPEVQLDRLRWVQTDNLNMIDEDKLISLPAGGLSTTAIVADSTKLNELGFVTAQISSFMGDYRGALESVHKLTNILKANAQVAAVEVLQEPVNVSSFVNLEGSTSDEQAAQTQPALFKLKIILKPSVAEDMTEIN